MSWTMTATGDTEHLKEYAKRHLHHYNQHLEANERGVIRHVIGHAASAIEPGRLYALKASGHQDRYGYQMSVEMFPITPSMLPPPVPPEEDDDLVRDPPAPEAAASLASE